MIAKKTRPAPEYRLTPGRYTVGPDVDLESDDVRDGRGNRITVKRAEQIAEQALATVRAGRPSLSGERQHSPHVSFRVPRQIHAQAKARALDEGVSVSELARRALEHYLGSVAS